MTRILALDVGKVRIGVAVSDETGLLATPYTTLQMARDEAQIWAAIQRCLTETEARALVIGLPVSLDGEIHAQGKWVKAFARRLKAQIEQPVTFWDERFSTVEAQRLAGDQVQELADGRRGTARRSGQGKRKRQRPDQSIDARAATVILQEYLDHLRQKTEEKKYEE